MKDAISPKQFHEAEGVEDWRVLGGDGATAYFRTPSFATSAKLVQAISALPGVDDERPAVDVRPDGVTVRMITFTKDYAGMTQRHVELARHISAAARKLGPLCRSVGGPEPVDHPGRDLSRRGDAVLAGRTRI